jgi:opacity protein-like surface antigen
MGSLKTIALAGVVAVAASASSIAADLPPPHMPHYPAEKAEFGGGWYLRGDVGVGIVDFDKFEGINTTPGFVDPPNGYVLEQKSATDQVFVGGGVGYQFNHYLRGDLTGEYRTAIGLRTLESYSYGGPTGYNTVKTDLSSAVGLANVYVDLGNWYGITPFIGAGVGFAHHYVKGLTDAGFGSAAGGIGYAKDVEDTQLAWAVHAGLGYDVTPNLKLELAYRYLNMGDAQAGKLVCAGGVCPGTVYSYKDLESHDIKIGMRWMLASYGPAPIHAPAPLIRKY